MLVTRSKTIRIQPYPKTYENYVFENSAIAEAYDKDIVKLCFAQAAKFIEHNADSVSPLLGIMQADLEFWEKTALSLFNEIDDAVDIQKAKQISNDVLSDCNC